MNPEPHPIDPNELTAPDTDEIALAADEAPLPAPPEPVSDWRYWLRRLLVCNPFFLCSAALLLFGINRLSVDPEFLGNEVENLLFNFSALQFYEVLVVVTALVLARRRVWYDSALLVVLENGLALVPFMLISQATLIDGRLAGGLTLAGGAVAAGRFLSVRRWYPQFNLPWRALLLGGAILAANMALPRIFRPMMEVDVENWRGPNLVAWYLVLPLLAAGANLLPRPWRYGGLNPERHWLPLFIYGLWIAGTAVHVWCVAYICRLPFEMHLLGPLALVAAWTVWSRLSDCVPNPSASWERAALLLTFCAPLLSFAQPWLFVTLAELNLLAYIVLCLLGCENVAKWAKHLALASLPLILAGMPLEWGNVWLPDFSRGQYITLAGIGLCVLLALQSRRLELGLLGAVAVAVAAGGLAREWSLHAAVQAGLVFLMLHSLSWLEEDYPNGNVFRRLAALLWVIDAWAWTRAEDWLVGGFVAGGALLVLGAWCFVRLLHERRGLGIVALAAALVMASGPANWFLHNSAEGVIALAGSLVLFAAGIVVAWRRHHWEQRDDGGVAP